MKLFFNFSWHKVSISYFHSSLPIASMGLVQNKLLVIFISKTLKLSTISTSVPSMYPRYVCHLASWRQSQLLCLADINEEVGTRASGTQSPLCPQSRHYLISGPLTGRLRIWKLYWIGIWMQCHECMRCIERCWEHIHVGNLCGGWFIIYCHWSIGQEV